LVDTDYILKLIVNDGQLDSPEDEVKIKVRNVDHPPYIIEAIKDIIAAKNSADHSIDLATVFADDDFGDLLSFSVSENSNNAVVTTIVNGNLLTLVFLNLNVGKSELEVTASSNGRNVKLKFQVEVTIPTALSPEIAKSELLVYPNPSKGLVNVKYNQIPKAGSVISVYTISGKLIYQKHAVDKEELLDLKHLSSGIYLLKTNMDIPTFHKLILD